MGDATESITSCGVRGPILDCETEAKEKNSIYVRQYLMGTDMTHTEEIMLDGLMVRYR